MSVADLVTAVLLPAGAIFSVLGALGMARFPDLLTRLHAATKPQTIGLLLVLAGVAAQMHSISAVTPLVLVALFQLITSPVIAQTIGAVAYRTGEVDRGILTVDESGDGE
ncbi:multisubunit sodium/proton antiporter, MrpG subunit [Thermomonospora echinospora]|uniref:Multisubunit sodium/proton antiporter, MrpG subunit n=1 Tax=Thermomonospora echinospora TaxID=1992 RepID=A0A1H6C823_9ACTN|nr:monovalent cation/H(+) antiporter subunit G [Thermomonospora echinospora]SEG69111.1 multisubunit sodium/proton antiporter, MrpG subunit [Thermomonospora echinospora]